VGAMSSIERPTPGVLYQEAEGRQVQVLRRLGGFSVAIRNEGVAASLPDASFTAISCY